MVKLLWPLVFLLAPSSGHLRAQEGGPRGELRSLAQRLMLAPSSGHLRAKQADSRFPLRHTSLHRTTLRSAAPLVPPLVERFDIEPFSDFSAK